MATIKVIMCCSTLDTKGGMVSVVKNYLDYTKWDNFTIKYIPTHYDTENKVLLSVYFLLRYIQVVVTSYLGGYKIAHLHTAERGSFWRKSLLLKTLRLLGLKVVMHHHGAEFEKFYVDSTNEQQDRINKTLTLADVNVVLSDLLVSMITDKAPLANVKVLYNSVFTPETNLYNKSARNVLFLGRLGKRKGTFDLIEAISRLDKEIPNDIKFYLCGDMGETETWKLIREKKVEHRIAHVGWIDGQKKREFLANSMINCLPSYNEGLPMTILETMAMGIPNISTRIASIPEVLNDGENGYMITPGDIDALTEKLKQLILDEELRIKFSNNSYNLIQDQFSIDHNISQLKQIYYNLVNVE